MKKLKKRGKIALEELQRFEPVNGEDILENFDPITEEDLIDLKQIIDIEEL